MSQADDLLAQLNPRQREAACHGRGPLLIIAGAGTGKTTTLAHRVAHLIGTGTDPRRMMLLTFTRRAAAELLRRVDALLRELDTGSARGGRPAPLPSRQVWGGTFHAVATRLLRQHGRLIGLNPEFTILDRSDSEDLLNVVRGELELAKSGQRFPLKGTCLAIYSRCVNARQRVETVLQESFPWCLEWADELTRLFETFVDRKEQQRLLDYDDLLLFWQGLVAEPAGAKAVRAKFDCVLVDEYQDTNVLQSEILKDMLPDGAGLTVVGDDAQSIYSFRAATVRNILDFPQQFPGTTVIPLEQNYRSTQPILAATNQVIALSTERHEKELWSARTGGEPPALTSCQDEDEQTDFVIAQILAHRESGSELKKQAVLFRASHHSLALEVELARRNIPFHKYGGLKFIETAHVKDLLAYLRLAENPRDVISGLRILMLLPGIGQKKAQQLLDGLLAAHGDFATWEKFRPPAAAVEVWPAFVGLMKRLSAQGKETPQIAAQVNAVRTFYAPLLEQRLDNAKARLRDLQQLEIVSQRFADRLEFLTQITLDPPSSTQELADDPLLDEDYLILSTIHSAKGLEWDAVYVIHVTDGNIPSDMATGSVDEIEEERRLLYVAMTRAKQWLYVCQPQRYYFQGRFRGDAHSFAQGTRFIPASLHEFFTHRPAFETLQPAAPAPHIGSTSNVRSRLKAFL